MPKRYVEFYIQGCITVEVGANELSWDYALPIEDALSAALKGFGSHIHVELTDARTRTEEEVKAT